MTGPCLCGDPYCWQCGGGRAVEPPGDCPACHEPNADENGTLLDEATFTCGDTECKELAAAWEKQRAALEAEDERRANEAEAAWLSELEKMTP